MALKTTSIHFVFQGKSDYKDLAPVFPDILREFLIVTELMPMSGDEIDEEVFQMYVEINMADLRNNVKPEGYNRKGKLRLVFPMDRKEFYLKAYAKTSPEAEKLRKIISEKLDSVKFKYKIEENLDLDFY